MIRDVQNIFHVPNGHMHFFGKMSIQFFLSIFKETINKTKRQCTEQKIFANDMIDKGLIANIYKHTIQHSKAKQPN